MLVRQHVLLLGLASACSSGGHRVAAPPASAPADEVLAYSVREGAIENHFYRRGPIAAHALATSGETPRVLVSFPAGNSGVGLWLAGPGGPVSLEIEGGLAPVEDGALRGVRFTVRAGASELRLAKAILGGNWSLREWVPPGLTFPPLVNEIEAGPPARISRTTLDGDHRIEAVLAPRRGTAVTVEGDTLVLRAGAGASQLSFEVTAMTDEEPLTPIPMSELLTDTSSSDQRLLRALAFLSYREKLLAGSWRFLSYFGRDTLLTVRLLMPAARPEVTEAGIGSVIDRLSANGEVAHYEETGEFVTLRHLATDPATPRSDLRAPYYEYKMVDDNLMLAPVLADYLATPTGGERAAAFLGRRTPAGETYASAIRRNLAYVLAAAGPYAESPTWQSLIAFHPDYPWGEWRDSDRGNGGGKISYNVNVALVPAALRAAAALLRRPELGARVEEAARAEAMAAVWEENAPAHFRVELAGAEARARAGAYAKRLGLEAAGAVGAIGDSLAFPAISLDGEGAPIPIMHSDDSFVLLFGRPGAEALEETADRILAPFPAGLRTPVGVVVANPAYAPRALQEQFTATDYHGTVVWSWQQAMLAAGLRRQLERGDLAPATREKLAAAERALWEVINATRAQRAGELWSFGVEDGRITLLPFEVLHEGEESNAAQLWSTVYLAVKPPG